MLQKIVADLMGITGEFCDRRIQKTCSNPLYYNERLLKQILKRQKNTEFGKRHGFSAIENLEEFRRKVPLSTYSDYQEDVERMMNGEKNILMKGNPVAYCESSGTTGKSKVVPASSQFAWQVFFAGTPFLGYYYAKRDGLDHIGSIRRKLAAYASFAEIYMTPTGKPIVDVIALMADRSKVGLRVIGSIPVESTFCSEYHDTMYVMLLFNLMNPDLFLYVSSYVTDLCEIVNYLFDHQKRLLHDMREGKISDDVDLPEALRRKLNKKLSPRPQQADELQRILAENNRSGILKRIFPRLQIIFSIGGYSGDLSQQTKICRNYAGEKIRFLFLSHAAAEGQYGLARFFDQDVYTPSVRSTFMEFIPIDDRECVGTEIYTVDQLEVGKKYELIITNCSGLYRYRTFDVILVTGKEKQMPLYKVLGRSNQTLNLCGEKTTAEQLDSAVTQALRQLNLELIHYMATVDFFNNTGRYCIYMELAGALECVDVREMETMINKLLGKTNSMYLDACKTRSVKPLEIRLLIPGSCSEVYRQRHMSQNHGGNNVKIPVIFHDEATREFFDKNCILRR